MTSPVSSSPSSPSPIAQACPAPVPEPVAPAAEVAAAAAAAPVIGSAASLYVGDLDASVAESNLVALFSQVAPVVSAHVCRDMAGQQSLGYGYVNFHTREDANRALEAFNFTVVNGKSIRIMFSNKDPTMRRSGRANLFIKNLEPNIDNKSLYDMFSSFGTILSCKVATDFKGQSKGYGFVQFDSDESAQNAINSLNGMLANGKKVFVSLFMRRQEREGFGGATKFTNVYVKNLPKEFTEDDLRKEFAPFGEITSAVVMRDADGRSRCFGFVDFEKPEYAASAIENLNGKLIRDMVLYVGKAQKKSERLVELKAKFGHEKDGKVEKAPYINLYLKNMDDNVNDEHLRKMFEGFGEIGSCKVMVDLQGRSKGSGFVSFATIEAACNAINRMNGAMVGGKPLYVAMAQRKQERREMLMAHFARINNHLAAMAPIAPTLAAPPILPQFCFAPAPAVFPPPPPANFGFPQHFIPGMAHPDASNIMMRFNMPRPRHPTQRTGGRHGGFTREMHDHHQHRQMFHPNGDQSGVRSMPNPVNRVIPTMLPRVISGPMSPLPQEVKNLASSDPTSSNLTTTLASANPDEQQEILGSSLYPLVEQLEREHPGKVTGMLLEMDKNEVLNLIESPDDLRHKVDEAKHVLEHRKGETSSTGSGDGEPTMPPSSGAAATPSSGAAA